MGEEDKKQPSEVERPQFYKEPHSYAHPQDECLYPVPASPHAALLLGHLVEYSSGTWGT